MQAFMSGQMRVEGDVTKLMVLQTVQPSDDLKDLMADIREITSELIRARADCLALGSGLFPPTGAPCFRASVREARCMAQTRTHSCKRSRHLASGCGALLRE